MRPMSRHQLQRTIRQLKHEQQLHLGGSHDHLCNKNHSHSHGHHPQTLPRVADSRDISRLRRRQMLQRHISSRRGLDRVGRSSELQANLYRFLNQHQSRRNPASDHTPAPSPPPSTIPAPLKSTPTPPPPPPDRNAIQCLPGELLDLGRRRRETERRKRLLHAIGLLNRMPLRERRDEADKVESKGETESRSGATNILSSSNASAAVHKSPSSDMVKELQQLADSLRYLSVACHLRPTFRGSAAGVEWARELESTRRIVSGMLKRSGCGRGSGGESCGQDKQKQKKSSHNRSCDPVFWRCPVHTELMQRSRQQQRQQSPKRADKRSKRCPPARSSSCLHGGSGSGDSVAEVIDRANSALLGDPVFHVNSLGKEFCWGKMTVPVSQLGVTNAADRLGRKNLHRSRMHQRREAAAAEIEEFADCIVDKWEAIETTRVDRSIDAACRRLRRAIHSTRGGRGRHSSGNRGGSKGRCESEPSVRWKPGTKQTATAAAKGASGESTAAIQARLPRHECAYI